MRSIVSLISIIVLFETAFALEKIKDEFKEGSEPEGFSQYKWETDFNDFNEEWILTFSKSEEEEKTYIKRRDFDNKSLKMENIKVYQIKYTFYRNKLYRVSITCEEGLENALLVKKVLTEKYGDVTNSSKSDDSIEMRWWGERTLIFFDYNIVFKNMASIAYVSKKISDYKLQQKLDRLKEAEEEQKRRDEENKW